MEERKDKRKDKKAKNEKVRNDQMKWSERTEERGKHERNVRTESR